MEEKKSAKANLEKGKGLSILMGLVVALAIVFVSFEWGTRDIEIIKYAGVPDIFTEEEMDITLPEDTPPPPPPPPAPEATEVINIVEDDVDLDPVEILSSEDNQANAQPDTYKPPTVVEEEEESTHTIFTIVEDMPEFPGGDLELQKWVNKQIKYPVIAQENGIQGRVVCTFVINQDGTVVEAEVIRGIDPSLDKEALRVINQMPKWTPGKQRGKAVRVKYTLPVFFRLQ